MSKHEKNRFSFGARSADFSIVALMVLSMIVAPVSASAQAVETGQASYKTADEAVEALISAAKEDGIEALLGVLGSDAEEIVDSGDPVADRATRERFLEAYGEAHELRDEGENAKTLVIGAEEYPFPIPLVFENGSWRFHTVAGLDEILTRRIGENETSVINVMQAYVVAQEDYASADRDGKGPHFARRILSSEGQKDGLYWPTAEGEEPSPLGPLIAGARAEGYGSNGASEEATPATYHGYVYKQVLKQGPSAKGGARDYVVNDRMIGGFALIAAPADYGNSGIMTFMVNQDGVVYERDLGEETSKIVAAMDSFDPDDSWTVVEVGE
jgi:Protein of unknown function (DUF2950)